MLVLPGLGPEQTAAVMGRLSRQAPVRFTWGAWQWHPDEEFLAAVDEADQVMYAYKQKRRERPVQARHPH